jgi:intraflagellar transport protein 52
MDGDDARKSRKNVNGETGDKAVVVLFDASKKEAYYPTSGMKKLARKLKASAKIDINKDDLSKDRIKDASLIVFAGVRERFSSSEFATLREFMQSGGSVLFMLGEGGEETFDTNLNGWLKEYVFLHVVSSTSITHSPCIFIRFGIFVNADAVIRTVYHKYHHPKEVLISSGIVNREIARVANELSGKKELLQRDLHLPGTDKSGVHMEKDQKGLTFVYPYGATLNVKPPSAPILSTGFISFPVNRPVAAVWQDGGVSGPPSKSGRLAVFGSAQWITDEWIDKEENAKLQEIIFRWLLKEKGVQWDANDAKDPDLAEPNRLPDTQALSERLRSCMQESEELPKDFTRLFDGELFKFDTSLIPEAVTQYKELGLKHEPLTLIPPQVRVPLDCTVKRIGGVRLI